MSSESSHGAGDKQRERERDGEAWLVLLLVLRALGLTVIRAMFAYMSMGALCERVLGTTSVSQFVARRALANGRLIIHGTAIGAGLGGGQH